MDTKERDTALEILLVEDNPGDILLAREAFECSRIKNHLNIVKNGSEAVEFLKKEGNFRNAPIPDLILLDLNLPQKNGREVLTEIKQDDQLRNIPVIVFSSSESEQDIQSCYELWANCYISKPVDYDGFLIVIRSIENFWFSTVTLPSRIIK